MSFIKSVPVVLAGTLLLAACGQEEVVKLENHIDQASYGVGLNIGRQLSQEDVEMNAEAIAAGIKDALSEADQRIPDEVIQGAFEKIREEQMRKQEALGDAVAKAGEEFLAENAAKEGVTVTDSGLQYEVMTAVDGDAAQPTAADTVSVHYHGTLIDGTVFDSSVERGEPVQFPLGNVIPGWTEGVQLMKVGEKFKFFIPAELAYGARSPSPKIPANSALVFEVELLEIVAE
ncbi:MULTISPECIES: FKBP-type peptidyl-prolyl cis-trans isomerase [unclassified Oceanobacter]|uniref:FKBP-type peptidyl-prolyl cis-trans isomerase n=1 Tax=unclassified Oceanobacter TaxID=2620260 RepID=UPI0026E3435B|nr:MULTISPECIES: FKBP-type peptidyl-prolyl cis-trans isomerase [unclassified Oceanobacter]MDO6681454.1 FKBP-type peptidyl-prolyl cis-trans isomerase [Oceanobacter sp. 5_MG-2023]MDP2548736.1 FKBP-type peptidyl-prolyl cis-trans isomerase [Oceanobacter sp. 4_MG-2023]MDP2609313.1 FKBP-type peptidyl-prolyl cis-trans isomerase [Oceanobacter sp. 1_MG-2023]MDP2612590.1 FKBP-type peptidyl-prolyl cis-trans isomerase [Oceanobacter sp. 2_MG-2023]